MKMKSLAVVVTVLIPLFPVAPRTHAEDAPAYARWKEFSDKIKSEPEKLVSK